MDIRARTRTRFLTMGAIAASIVAVIVPLAPAASAGPVVAEKDFPGCPAKTFCLFEDTYFVGAFRERFPEPGTQGYPRPTYKQCHFKNVDYLPGKTIDNKASSMINNTSFYVVLYRNDGCGGDVYSARPHSEDTTFSNNGFNDKASGAAFVDKRT